MTGARSTFVRLLLIKPISCPLKTSAFLAHHLSFHSTGCSATTGTCPRDHQSAQSGSAHAEVSRRAPSPFRSWQGPDYSGDISDFRTALQRLREDLDRLKQMLQDLLNKNNLTAQDIDVSSTEENEEKKDD